MSVPLAPSLSPAATAAPTSLFSCTAATRSFVQTDPAMFWNTRSIIRGHSVVRFGYPSNITLAIEGTSQDRRAYAAGLLAASILMLAFVGAWLVVLIALKCAAGRQRHKDASLLQSSTSTRTASSWRFLAGWAVTVPPRPTSAFSASAARPHQESTERESQDKGHRTPSLPSLLPPMVDDDNDNNDDDDDDDDNDVSVKEEELPEQGPQHRQRQRLDDQPHGEVPAIDDSHEPKMQSARAGSTYDDDEKCGGRKGDVQGNGRTSLKEVGALAQEGSVPCDDSGALASPPWDTVSSSSIGGDPSEEDKLLQQLQEEAWSKTVRDRYLRAARIRVTVLVAGFTIVVMAILLIVYGIQRLSGSVSDSVNGIDQALALCDSAVTILDSFLRVRNDTLAVASAAAIETNFTVCPPIEAAICGGQPCSNILQQIVDYFTQNQGVYDSLANIQHDVVEIQSLLTSVDETITSFDYAFWVAAAAVGLLAVCALVLMNGVVLAWRHRLRGTCWHRTTARFRGYLVVPIFVVLLVIGWIASMVFVIGSTATADFCFDSPNQNVLAVLNQLKDNFSSILYPMLVYYVSGCPDLSVVQSTFVKDAEAVLNLLGQSETFVAALKGQSYLISQVCGTDPTTVTLLLSQLDALLCYASNTIFDTVDFFTCANWNGLYASVMYSAVCYNGNTGFAWIAVAQFIIVLCSLVMLTLRAAFYELVEEESPANAAEDEESLSELKPVGGGSGRPRALWRLFPRRSTLNQEAAPSAGKPDAELPIATEAGAVPEVEEDDPASAEQVEDGPRAANEAGPAPVLAGSANNSSGGTNNPERSMVLEPTVRVSSLYSGSLPTTRENL